MSLQHAAKHLEKHGRNGDTMLVHMSPGEVKSLNDIAMAHGGYLTTNPHTGLPEAGFLSKILPMVAGAALSATGIGAPVAALLVGGGTAALTGDIKKGLMAGLGAYGGAGIGSALATSGTQAAAQAATPSVSLAETAAATPPAPAIASGSPMGGIGYATPPAPVIAPPPATVLGSGSPMAGVNITPTPVNAPLSVADQTIPANSAASNFRNVGNQMFEGAKTLASPEGRSAFMTNLEAVPGTYGAKTTLAAAAAPLFISDEQKNKPKPIGDSDPGQQYTYTANPTMPTPTPDPYGREQRYFNPMYVPRAAGGGSVEAMSNANAMGANTGYPMADINKPVYASPFQTPISNNVVHGTSDTGVNPMTGEISNFARGGLSDAQYNLGGYSDGGRLLRGPGDGVSDSIPAVIGRKQPARLADGEFVVPARIVSELGNGSTEAGARKLYAMMDRIQKARGKTVGKGKVAKNSRAERYLPA